MYETMTSLQMKGCNGTCDDDVITYIIMYIT